MKAVSKKLFSLLLVAILLVSAVPFQAMATSGSVLTLDANGGLIGTALSTTQAVTVGQPIGTLPAAEVMSRANHIFTGWYKADGTKVESGTIFDGSFTTIYAGWKLIEKGVTIKAVYGGLKSQAVDIRSENVAAHLNLLDYLNAIKGEIGPGVGYSWNGYWYDYSTDALIDQNESFSNWRTVYVKFEPKQFKLYFNAGDGASVGTTEKTVTMHQSIGELPVPTRPGYIFVGWHDINGIWQTNNSIYQANGDTTLYAAWKKQASVVLEIFINGKTAEPDRCPALVNYGEGDIVSRSSVASIVKKYYSSSNGSNLTIAGLYTSDMWQDYLADKSVPGVESIQLPSDGTTTYIYVMVNNAKQGSSSTTTGTTGSNGGSTTPADPTNPKTGDNSMIFASVTVMLAAATALVAIEVLRKKRMI